MKSSELLNKVMALSQGETQSCFRFTRARKFGTIAAKIQICDMVLASIVAISPLLVWQN